MIDQQLTLLSQGPSQYDINAVDVGVIHPDDQATISTVGLAVKFVDDRIFGLGFTNWNYLLEHAVRTGHVEIYQSGDTTIGLKKRGYKYGAIPKMPVDAAVHVQRRLLSLATVQQGSKRDDKMLHPIPGFSFKLAFDEHLLVATVKIKGSVTQVCLNISDLMFSGSSTSAVEPLATQICSEFLAQGGIASPVSNHGFSLLASHVIRLSQGVR